MRLAIAAALCALAGVSPQPAGSQALGGRALTGQDLVQLKRISDPVLAPDGRHVVYALRETELEANRARTSLWIKSVGTQEPPSRLTHGPGSDSSPRWAPDGRHVFFLSSRSGSSQVWRIPIAGGEAQPVTDYPLPVSTFKVSPKGQQIAVTMQVYPDCLDLQCNVERSTAAAAGKASGKIYDALFVRHWDAWRDPRLSMLFTARLDANGKASLAVNVSRGLSADVVYPPGANSDYEFSPDGARLVFSARVRDSREAWSTNFDLYEAAVDGSAVPRNLTADNKAWDAQPTFLANGDLAYLAMVRPGFEADRFRVVLRDAHDGRERVLTESWDRSVKRLRASLNGRELLATVDDVGQLALFSIDIVSGRRTRLVGEGQVVDFVPAPGGGALIEWAALDSPPDLYLVGRKTPALKRLTSVNADTLSHVRLSGFEQFSFAGWNGETVYGHIVKPLGLDTALRYPIAFLVHGGPQATQQNQWNWRWNAQAFAARGYAVIMIDFHGSTGYGQAFTDSISRDWGGKPFVDLQKGLDAALARNAWLDGGRVCSLGGSYGGYMQNWIAGNWPERFRCIVNHAGIFDTRTMSYTTEELWFSEWELGRPHDDLPTAERFNPSASVSRWRTPMLVTHGALDFRVPFEQGLGAFTALQQRGIESRLLYFPDENHWISKPANVLQWYEAVLAWLDGHLK